MLSYSDHQVKEIISSILERDDFAIEAIGNHHLNRHLVYKIILPGQSPLIFKLYYRSNRRSREIASLRLLEKSDVNCPRIFKIGNLNNGEEWLIVHFISGDIFDNIINVISQQSQLELFEQMGEMLGKIHSFQTFDFFGDWDEKGVSLLNINNYYDVFVQGTQEVARAISSQELPDKELLMQAIEEIKDNYHLFNVHVKSRLRHNDFDGRNILVDKQGQSYGISGIIDFEQSCPGNPETDLVGLYYRYFLDNKDREQAFILGYQKYLSIDQDFYKRLHIHLLRYGVGNCSWSYSQAPDYYRNNINFLKKLKG